MRAFLLLAGIAGGGCHFVDGLAPSDGHQGDGPPPQIDADLRDTAHVDPDGGSAGCIDRWLTGPTFGAAVAQTMVNALGTIDHPVTTADDQTLYVGHNGDIYVALRLSPTQFGSTVYEAGLSTMTANEYKISITANGLQAYVTSGRGGGVGNIDIWHTQRASTGVVFSSSWNHTYLPNVDTQGNDWDPFISNDDLHLYVARGDGIAQHIELAVRDDPSHDFDDPATITELRGTNAVDNRPTLTSDERVIVFESTRAGGNKLFYATRTDPTGAFGMPALVPLPNAGTQDDPHVSADGCHLYYVSTGKLYLVPLN